MAEVKLRVMNDEGEFVPLKSQQEAVSEEAANEVNEVQPVDVEATNDAVEETTDVAEATTDVVETEKIIEEQPKEASEVAEEPAAQIDESSILKHLKERYNAQFESLDEVLKHNEQEQVVLPEDVSKFMEYKKETGRGLEDFMRVQQDLDKVDENTLLHEYYKETKPYLGATDVPDYIEENFGLSEDAEDVSNKRKQLAYKEELYNAKKHFDTLKEKYKTPLESSKENIPEEYQEAYEGYNNYINELEKTKKSTEERAAIFSDKTNKLFKENFKGFEYNVGDKSVVFKPKNVDEVHQTQSNLNNYIDKFLDDSGYLNDADGFHRSLNLALNPDNVAKFFYEQGVADATEGLVKKTKNIDMDVRSNTDTENKGGLQYRVLDDSDFTDFKIRKK